VILLLEIIAHSLLEISGFAYVDHRALAVCEKIASGIVGKRIESDHAWKATIFSGYFIVTQVLCKCRYPCGLRSKTT
jgi:hypothetical protein